MKTKREICGNNFRAREFQGIAQDALDRIVFSYINGGSISRNDPIVEKLFSANLGYAEYILNHPNMIREEYRSTYRQQDYLIAHSSVSDVTHIMHNNFVLTGTGQYAFQVNNRREIGTGHNKREKDTESKIIERLMAIFDPTAIGSVELYTYYEPCLSCESHIIEFARMFPTVELTIYYEEKYNIV